MTISFSFQPLDTFNKNSNKFFWLRGNIIMICTENSSSLSSDHTWASSSLSSITIDKLVKSKISMAKYKSSNSRRANPE